SINSHQIHDCIKAAIKTWQFPKPTGAEVVVSYPFIFDLVAF
ncbi:MAG: AgmX/PglI C-terminal domain-containing protein, partial [Desulfatitalea sp.]|nr:AgmX/PglI C-terminal domain-containing protein [Desulfatitalea sp.]NNK00968.1 AgmX/PglI C-terminal domain-containing protein [Desulfatitalea sp.]